MALSEPQKSVLSFLGLATWSTAIGVAQWRGCTVQTATMSLDALRRRGLAVCSDQSEHWRITPRGLKVLAGKDPRCAR